MMKTHWILFDLESCNKRHETLYDEPTILYCMQLEFDSYFIDPFKEPEKYTGSSTYDQLPFWLVGCKSDIYLLTVFSNLFNIFIIFIQLFF
jgi:hypothetical protein